MTTEIIVSEDIFLMPQQTTPVEVARQEMANMVELGKTLIVDNEPAYKVLTALYNKAREWKKAIEYRRKKMVEPARQEIARINDRAKELSDPLDKVIDVANGKTNVYKQLLERQKKEADQKLRDDAALFEPEAQLYIEPMENIIRGEGAIAVTKVEKKFEVEDISKVPLKYLMINEAEVKMDIKLGINNIPGLKIYEETKTQLRIR